MTSENKKEAVIQLRPDELESLTALARLHRRSLQDEMRLALRVHMRRVLLDYIRRPAGRSQLASQGYDADEQEASIRRGLERAEAEAFSLPDDGSSVLRPHDHLWLGR